MTLLTSGITFGADRFRPRNDPLSLPKKNVRRVFRKRKRRWRSRPKRPPLSVEQILAWADAFHADRGRWPNVNSGLIEGTIDDTWSRIDDNLRAGNRGLPDKSRLTLARLLERRRGVRNSEYPPKLTMQQIVKWAKRHRRRTGEWPKAVSGPIDDAPGETWMAIDLALRKGRRGLVARSSLAQFLTRHCGVRNHMRLPRLTVAIILKWADAYRRWNGNWPHDRSGPIPGSGGETWLSVAKALRKGRRNLPKGLTLWKLLSQERVVVRRKSIRT